MKRNDDGDRAPSGGIRRKLLRSHWQVTLIGVGALALVLASMFWLRYQVIELAERRLPVLQDSMTTLRGVKQCLAALRGWVVLGDRQFIEQRLAAWSDVIRPAVARMKQHGWQEVDDGDRAAVPRLERALDDLEAIQWRIEDVAQAPGNERARVALLHHVDPVAQQLLEAMTSLMRREAQKAPLQADVALLGAMADFRFHLSSSRDALSRFIDAGQYDSKLQFHEHLVKLNDALRQIETRRDGFNAEQVPIFANVRKEVLAYKPVTAKAIELRQADDWNLARHWLASQAVAKADDVTAILSQIETAQRLRTEATSRRVYWSSNLIVLLSLGTMVTMGVCATMFSRRAAEHLTRPVDRLVRAAESLRRGVWPEDLPVTSDDELGALTDSFNQMRRSLRELNSRLAESSRVAGRAEVATGVLHNVGNVLNSVNVSANLLMEKLHTSRVARLAHASEVIAEHQGDLATFFGTERGRHFPRYLEELSANLCEERDAQQEELRLLAENIEHIKEIIKMQQTYAHLRGSTEPVDLAGLVEDALKISDVGLRQLRAEVYRRFDEVPPVVTEKHKVLQILVNLLSNARYALGACDHDDKQLALIVASDQECVCIQVRDNGVGIAPEDVTKIFSYGFTTRKEGHGYGLHSSALAAQELGGDLSVESSGPGRGAVFTLRLPIHEVTRCKGPTNERIAVCL